MQKMLINTADSSWLFFMNYDLWPMFVLHNIKPTKTTVLI